MSTTFGTLLFEGVEELDAVGPYEVLAVWQQYFPDDARVRTSPTPGSSTGCAPSAQPFRC